MTGFSKRKGTSAELEVVAAYRNAGFRAARVPLSGAGLERGDVKVAGLGMHCEVKRCEALRLWDALAQTAADTPNGHIPALHFRRNRSPWYVALPLEDWLLILDLAVSNTAPTTIRQHLEARAA